MPLVTSYTDQHNYTSYCVQLTESIASGLPRTSSYPLLKSKKRAYFSTVMYAMTCQTHRKLADTLALKGLTGVLESLVTLIMPKCCYYTVPWCTLIPWF